MIIGSLWIDLRISQVRSLKEKRRILKSMKERLRSEYNVAVAEVGSNDIWQRAEIGIACVGNDQARIHHILAKIVDKIRYNTSVSIIDYQTDVF